MKVKREWKDYTGKVHQLDDVSVVAEYLKGYIDEYSGGQIEHMNRAIANLRELTAKLLVELHGDKVVALCEDKEAK
jgi:hypothetical protein